MRADLKRCAVGGQTAVEARAHTRTQIAAYTGGAHEAYLRLDLLEQVDESRSVRIGGIGIKLLILELIDRVGAIFEDLLLHIVKLVADYDCLKLHAEVVGELSSLGQQLKADVGHLAVVVLAIYYEIVGVCHIVFFDI